jgi:hypothetical protein
MDVLVYAIAKQPNLKLKTRPKQLLCSQPLVFSIAYTAPMCWVSCSRSFTYPPVNYSRKKFIRLAHKYLRHLVYESSINLMGPVLLNFLRL